MQWPHNGSSGLGHSDESSEGPLQGRNFDMCSPLDDGMWLQKASRYLVPGRRTLFSACLGLARSSLPDERELDNVLRCDLISSSLRSPIPHLGGRFSIPLWFNVPDFPTWYCITPPLEGLGMLTTTSPSLMSLADPLGAPPPMPISKLNQIDPKSCKSPIPTLDAMMMPISGMIAITTLCGPIRPNLYVFRGVDIHGARCFSSSMAIRGAISMPIGQMHAAV
jgi:hypothetical protein